VESSSQAASEIQFMSVNNLFSNASAAEKQAVLGAV
jgi:hypothetical protein